jgi:hypothetical protein
MKKKRLALMLLLTITGLLTMIALFGFYAIKGEG